MSTHEDHAALVPAEQNGHSPSAELERIAPGLPAHRPRHDRHRPAGRQRGPSARSRSCSASSALATIAFCVAFVAFPDAHETITIIPGIFEPSVSNLCLGLTLGLRASSSSALGAIHWAKKLMVDEEIVEERHAARLPDEDTRRVRRRSSTGGVEESGIADALAHPAHPASARCALLPLPAVLMLRDLGPLPRKQLDHTTI